jgi:cytosine deaminase
MTRVKEQAARGLAVAFGHDCVMDPWYSLGSGDMLEVAQMALHVGQLTSLDDMTACYRAVTDNAAKILALEGYGVKPGCWADLVVLQASDPIEAIRLRPARLFVIRRGNIVSETAPVISQLSLAGRPSRADFRYKLPVEKSNVVTVA